MSGFYTAATSRILKHNVIQYAGGQASLPTTAFQAQTRTILVATQVAGWITVGQNNATTATASNTYLPTGVALTFTVTPGQNLAFISTSTSTGAVSVTELGA